MLKKLLIGATFLAVTLTSCYSPLYHKYKSNITNYNTCYQAEDAYRNEAVENDIPPDFWKIRANLAECYLDSAWLELSVMNNCNDNYISIDHKCENSRRNLLSIPKKHQQKKEISDLIEQYYFICNTVLKNKKNREPESRPLRGEVPYLNN